VFLADAQQSTLVVNDANTGTPLEKYEYISRGA
jgi:hypothetical protein